MAPASKDMKSAADEGSRRHGESCVDLLPTCTHRVWSEPLCLWCAYAFVRGQIKMWEKPYERVIVACMCMHPRKITPTRRRARVQHMHYPPKANQNSLSELEKEDLFHFPVLVRLVPHWRCIFYDEKEPENATGLLSNSRPVQRVHVKLCESCTLIWRVFPLLAVMDWWTVSAV